MTELRNTKSTVTSEQWAVDAVRRHYEQKGYTVTAPSVTYADLEAVKGDEHLHLEVKYRSRIWPFITLSHKEFEHLCKEKNPDYRICEVVPRKTGPPLISVFRHSDVRQWKPAKPPVRVYFDRHNE